MAETEYPVHSIAIEGKIPKKARPSQTSRVLYSNQVEHLADELLSAERCAFVRVPHWNNHFGIYNKSQLMACRRLPAAYKQNFSEREDVTFSDLVQVNCIVLSELFKRKTGAASGVSSNNHESFRLVHGDADGFPGIVVDHYGSLLVVQSTSAVGDFLLDTVTAALHILCNKEQSIFLPILEKSTGQTRKMLGLPERIRPLLGPIPEFIDCAFSDLKMKFFPLRSQKTGLFLDQKINLQTFSGLLGSAFFFPNGRLFEGRMLDLCCYAGAWSAAAAQSGVRKFSMVDQDKFALKLAQENVSENASALENPMPAEFNLLNMDLFEALQKLNEEDQRFEIVVADPPAFAKSKKHIPEARRAYSRLTKQASSLVKTGGLFVICSCSRNISEAEFKELVFSQLAKDAQSDWQFICSGSQSPDHTVLADEYFAYYLKCYFFRRI